MVQRLYMLLLLLPLSLVEANGVLAVQWRTPLLSSFFVIAASILYTFLILPALCLFQFTSNASTMFYPLCRLLGTGNQGVHILVVFFSSSSSPLSFEKYV